MFGELQINLGLFKFSVGIASGTPNWSWIRIHFPTNLIVAQALGFQLKNWPFSLR